MTAPGVVHGTPVIAEIVPDPLPPRCEPVLGLVPLIVSSQGGMSERSTHVLARTDGTTRLHPLPGAQRLNTSSAREVLAGQGRVMLFERVDRLEDESLPWLQRRTSAGLFRMDLSNLTVDRAGYEPRPGFQTSLAFAGSPDGQRAVVAEAWAEAPPGVQPSYTHLRITMTLVGFDGGPARELLTFAGGLSGDGWDQSLQWSPDGSLIAFTAYSIGTYKLTVTILDTRDGQEAYRLDDTRLVGSTSWSPDSTRLLVGGADDVPAIHDISSGERTPLIFHPGPRPDSSVRGVPRMFGFADDHRLLVGTQRGTTVTVSAVPPDVPERERLLRWTGGEHNEYVYPTFAQLPAGSWVSR